MTVRRRGDLTHGEVDQARTRLTRAEEDRILGDRRYWHGVGIVARLRLHRELATEHDRCPLCGEDLR